MSSPNKLYKYRKFDLRALKMVTDHGLFFANPRNFDDPLDCSLSLAADISPKKLVELLVQVLLQNVHFEKKIREIAMEESQ